MRLRDHFPNLLPVPDGPPQSWTPFMRRLHAQFNLREISIVARVMSTIIAEEEGREVISKRAAPAKTTLCDKCGCTITYRRVRPEMCTTCKRLVTCDGCGVKVLLKPRTRLDGAHYCSRKCLKREWYRRHCTAKVAR